MLNLSLGRRHLANTYEVEAGIGVIAGNTVWSMPERLECEVLRKVRYINTLTFTFTFYRNTQTHKDSLSLVIFICHVMSCRVVSRHVYLSFVISLFVMPKQHTKYTQNINLCDPNRSRTMPPPCLQIYLWPRVTLTFDLLQQSCDITGIYRNVCLRDCVMICQIILEMSHRKDFC